MLLLNLSVRGDGKYNYRGNYNEPNNKKNPIGVVVCSNSACNGRGHDRTGKVCKSGNEQISSMRGYPEQKYSNNKRFYECFTGHFSGKSKIIIWWLGTF